MTTYVIPCSGDKVDHPAPAREFYTGQMFRHSLAAAQAMATDDPGPIYVLSAHYGLVPLTRVLHPYEQRMDEPGHIDTVSVTAQACALDIDTDVVALLPRVYFDALDAALEPLCIWPVECYEATAGIGEQHGINSKIISRSI